MDIEIKGLTTEELAYIARMIVSEMEERYEDLSGAYEAFRDECEESSKTYESGYEEGFEKGQEDLQIRAKRILDTFDKWEAYELVNVFGVTTNIELLNDIKTNYEKIINYENKKKQEEKDIHVGDELIDSLGYKFIVIMIEGKIMRMIDKNGDYRYTCLNNELFTKTGKHYPLEEMLKELE
jgi:hypothetical protein